MDSNEQNEHEGHATEYLFDLAGSVFDQNGTRFALVQQSPTPTTLNLEDSLTESTLVQQSHSRENFVWDSTPVLLPGNGTPVFDESVLDLLPQHDMLDSGSLGRSSPFSDAPWVVLPGRATLTQDYLQRMEPLVLPQSSFLRQEISLIGQYGFTLPVSGFAPYLHNPDLEHTSIDAEIQDIAITGCINLPNTQNTPALTPRVLEAERHIDPRSVTNLVNETMSGAHRDPFPVAPVSSSSAGLTVPSTRSTLSCSSKASTDSRKRRRSLKDLMFPDAVHDTQCPDCSKYYARSELLRHRRCHGPKRIPCAFHGCDKLFLDKKEEERHYHQTGHGGSIHQADTIYCTRGRCNGTKVSRKDNIERHNRNFHPDSERATSDIASVADTISFSQTGSL